jgi:hypothetical protein
MNTKADKVPSERQRVLAKQALRLAVQGSKLSRELREEDIEVTRIELLVPTAILRQDISNFVAAGADWFDQDQSGDTDTDWPGQGQ